MKKSKGRCRKKQRPLSYARMRFLFLENYGCSMQCTLFPVAFAYWILERVESTI